MTKQELDVHFGPAPRVVLVGPPGAGKSTIGRRLSRALNCELVDSDDLIEGGEGRTCGEIFAEEGEPAFREIEERYVARALESNGVVSLGGGAVLSQATRDLLEAMTVVLIDVSAEEGTRRTQRSTTRPVLYAEDPLAHYRNLLEQRRVYYQEVADYRARTDGRTPQQVVGDILSFLESL
ncbi:shikimate kinase [Corynebacterium lizhenjunii]|uniref:Shikimate kinase n=1 Tax=Corynebacterium lizhenjunii TaxID=2709394 RepID=A0A7T0KCF5_9CORY|nr:shikimate kinase [Corynebacterium lizhenjunii]QPK78215.1 shikimate kinase [Corynebacterium lizhenjunii]